MIQQLNLALWEAACPESGVGILDVEQIASQYGKLRWSDSVLWQVGRNIRRRTRCCLSAVN